MLDTFPGMEVSVLPEQRSTNTTPLHHINQHTFYSEQPHSFPNSIISSHSQLSYLSTRPPQDDGINLRRVPQQLYTPPGLNVPLSGRKPRKTGSRTESPGVQSSGGGSNIVAMVESTSPLSLSHHIHHLSEPRVNSSSSGSHSITPPNSNSNTTLSCGSGNSTSANIGVPAVLNHNNNHVRNKTREVEKNLKNSEKVKAKKCVLEEDEDVEKCSKNVCGAGGRIRTSWVGPNQEFLPICDALFNVISLALYFCDIVFDILTAYTWYNLHQEDSFDTEESTSGDQKMWWWHWSIVALVFILLSAVLSQLLSFKWYWESVRRGQLGPDGVELEGPPPPCSTGILLLLHLSFSGILWRYFKLFIPVDLRFVKNEVRDLCLLRLVHAFCEATPMLLIQLYLIWQSPGRTSISDFTVVSTSLSLFSVCWALASFSKNIRKQNVHKLVLTWLGVIFQFLWHLGTVVSRVVALSLYATVYHFWIFLVLILHWFCMLMWLISPKTLYHGEKLSTTRKAMYSALIAVVYTFCYVNVQERNSRQKVILYYVTMFLENSLLLSVWLIAKRYEDEIWYKTQVISCVFGGFAGGIFFMCLYYRYFHLKKLSYVYDASSSIYRSSSVLNGSSTLNMNAVYSTPVPKGLRSRVMGESVGEDENKTGICIKNSSVEGNNFGEIIKGNKSSLNPPPLKKVPEKYLKRNSDKVPPMGGGGGGRGALYNKINGHHIHHTNVPGVFNCRFHPAMKRKKKKPTSFVPPPAVQPEVPQNQNPRGSPREPAAGNGEPLNCNDLCNEPIAGAADLSEKNIEYSEGHGSRALSPEYTDMDGMYGKMVGRSMYPFWKRPLSTTLGSENEGSVCSRVDIQQKLQEKKKQQLAELREIEEEIREGKLKRPEFNEIPQVSRGDHQPIPIQKKQPWFRTDDQGDNPPVVVHPRFSTNPHDEVILDPQYLIYEPSYEGSDFYDHPDWPANYYEPLYQNEVSRRKANRSSKESIYKSYRMPSDIESQMSLPRSYTLPREFKYKRKFRKPLKTEQFVPSTNSSDGDVDSGGEDPEIYTHLRPYPFPLPSVVHGKSNGVCGNGGILSSNNAKGSIVVGVSSSAPQPSKKQPVSRRHKLHETKL